MKKSTLIGMALSLLLVFVAAKAAPAAPLDDWTQKSPAMKPSARLGHAMASVGGDQVLLFGGDDGTFTADETWVYDLSDDTWTLKSPATSPSARAFHAMASIGDDQVLLFGGYDASGRFDETWVYDLSDDTWTLKSPATSPSARDRHAMASIGGGQVVLFGGYDGAPNDETWVYDLSDNTWTQKSPATKPSARTASAMAFLGTGSSQVLLFGGVDASGRDDETWVYPALPGLSINDVSLDEGDAGVTSFEFTVSLDLPAGVGGVTFDIATADGTAQDDNPATEDNDYVPKLLLNQTIPAGSSTYTFGVTVNGDFTNEPDETFFVNVTNVTGAALVDGQGEGTITNDDVGASAPQMIQEAIDTVGSLPNSAFRNPSNRTPLRNKLREVQAKIARGTRCDLCQALSKLVHDVLPKMDGASPPPDWITGAAAEGLADQIRALIGQLQLEVAALGGCGGC